MRISLRPSYKDIKEQIEAVIPNARITYDGDSIEVLVSTGDIDSRVVRDLNPLERTKIDSIKVSVV